MKIKLKTKRTNWIPMRNKDPDYKKANEKDIDMGGTVGRENWAKLACWTYFYFCIFTQSFGTFRACHVTTSIERRQLATAFCGKTDWQFFAYYADVSSSPFDLARPLRIVGSWTRVHERRCCYRHCLWRGSWLCLWGWRMSRKCKNFTLRCTSDMPELTVTKGTFTLVQINFYSILLNLLQIQ